MTDIDKTFTYVAIDFGTTFSGYALRFKQQTKIFVNSYWAENGGFKAYKAPTCVLTEGEHDKFVAFGFEAQSKYNAAESDSDSDEDEKVEANKKSTSKDLHFYDEFKMMLKGEEILDEDMPLKAYDDHTCKAMDIFAMALKYLREHLLTEMGKQFETIPENEHIRWVLTVPAIWSDSAKQFMRKCATKAGIVDKDASDHLLIALEPEAASLYCRTLDLPEFQLKQNIPEKELRSPQAVKEKENDKNKDKLKEGLPRDSQYLVVDCGGGTVDVTAHHYKANGDICEIYAASGGPWGGGNVNKQFEKTINRVTGKKDIMKTYKQRLSSAYLNDKVLFEKQKRSIDFDTPVATYNFTCTYGFIDICQKENGNKKIKTIIKENQPIQFEGETEVEQDIVFSNGNLKFSKQALLRMFMPSVNSIKKHVLELIDLDELKQVGYIYLVGGFSDCSLLQKVMKEEFAKGRLKDKKIKVILAPYEASLAVVKGAVLFATNPHAISSRRARRFYCTSKSSSGKGRKRLEPIVKQNEEIYNDDVRHAHFTPYYDGTTFKLYHFKLDSFKIDSSKVPTKYSDDDGVQAINVDVSNIVGTNDTKDTKITIYMYFDSTEIHVMARNDKVTGGKQVKVTIDCLKHKVKTQPKRRAVPKPK